MSHWTEEVYIEQPELFADTLRRMDAVAEEEAENVLALAADEFGGEPSSILDVGCGMGRHALEFAERDITVHGIDISKAYLETARDRAESRGVSERVQFDQHDMRRVGELDATYDLVAALFGSFGLYGRETDQRIVTQLRELVADDGGLIVELANKAHELYNYSPYDVREVEDRFIVQRDDYDVETDVLRSKYDVFEGETRDYRGQMEFRYHLYSIPEMEALCHEAGFDSVIVVPKYAEELDLQAEILRYAIS